MRSIGLLSAALVTLVASEANAQVATAVAEERVDVNGDGRLDVIRIEEPASLSIRITGDPGASVWKPFTTSGRRLLDGGLSIGSGKPYGKRTVIVAVATFGKKRAAPTTWTHEALVVAWNHQRSADKDGHPHLVEVWRGAVGPQGRDREWSVHVEATPSGLLRYQRKPGVTRCDGAPPYLFPEGYDWKSSRFRPIRNLARVDETSPRLRASRRPPEGANPNASPAVFRARAASAQGEAGDAGELMVPREVGDGDHATAWRDALGGDGRGEFLTFTTSIPQAAVRALRILPGDASSAAAFRKANRLKSAALVLGTGTVFWLDFPEDPLRAPGNFDEAYWIELPQPVETDCVTVVIGDVYRSRGGSGETALSELAVFTPAELEGDGPFARWAEEVAAGGARATAAARALRGAGTRAAQAVIDETERRAGDAAALKRLRALLADLGDPAGAAQVAAGLRDSTLTHRERQALVAALIGVGEASTAPSLDLLLDDKATDPARASAVEVLAAIRVQSASEALIDAAGRGSRDLRRQIAIALGSHASADLQRVVEAASAARASRTVGREADLWRAVGVMVGGRATDSALRARASEALAGRLADATEYELRYRLFAAAAATDSPRALDALRAALGRTGSDAEGVALRRVAAAALARNPSPAARAVLVELAGDADPGVRKRVATALGQRDDGDETTDRTLSLLLSKDTWPMVRTASAGALGARCSRSRTADRALFDATDRDADLDVRIAALSALTGCAAPGVGDLLLKIANDGDRPGTLRVRAATLLGALGDRRYCPRVVELFRNRRRETWNSEAALRIAAAAAGALGALACTEGADALASAANDEAFPELQVAAVTALGELCPRDPKIRALLARLSYSANGRVAVAARSAGSGCGRKQTR